VEEGGSEKVDEGREVVRRRCEEDARGGRRLQGPGCSEGSHERRHCLLTEP
jgi:hypothetical protein